MPFADLQMDLTIIAELHWRLFGENYLMTQGFPLRPRPHALKFRKDIRTPALKFTVTIQAKLQKDLRLGKGGPWKPRFTKFWWFFYFIYSCPQKTFLQPTLKPCTYLERHFPPLLQFTSSRLTDSFSKWTQKSHFPSLHNQGSFEPTEHCIVWRTELLLKCTRTAF